LYKGYGERAPKELDWQMVKYVIGKRKVEVERDKDNLIVISTRQR